MIIVSTFISWGKQSYLRLFNHIIICMFCICSAAEFRAAFIEDSFFFFPIQARCIQWRGHLVHTHYVAFCQLASKLFYLGKRRKPCKNKQASSEAARGLSLPLPCFCISSPVSTFYDIPQMESLLAVQLFVDLYFFFSASCSRWRGSHIWLY